MNVNILLLVPISEKMFIPTYFLVCYQAKQALKNGRNTGDEGPHNLSLFRQTSISYRPLPYPFNMLDSNPIFELCYHT